jgi:hypothetical protein
MFVSYRSRVAGFRVLSAVIRIGVVRRASSPRECAEEGLPHATDMVSATAELATPTGRTVAFESR